MCGIVGIIGNPVQDIEARVAKMSNAIAHRGPDAAGVEVWSEGAAFAHRRLSIIDLSEAGQQPMPTPDGRYSISLNGEIYNYRALKKGLVEEGVEFRTNTDTEVLLRLYEKLGPKCLQLLRGMFAFAIRDGETGEVFAARDRLGIKPFYYFQRKNLFVFSSEVRALLASGLVPRSLDPISLSSYLSFGAVQEPRTMIENVRTLPPAHYVIVNARGEVKELARYWNLPSAVACDDGAVALAETRSRLEESIKLHLLADVPVGAFLSSGIDSSSIVALMSRHASGRVNTFTVCFEEQQFDERQLARQVAQKWGTCHTEIMLSEGEMLSSLLQAVAGIDQPTIDAINTWVVSRTTKQAGITVALSGLGGDELFGGYPSFSRAMRMRRYGAPMGWLGHTARRKVASLTTKVMGDSLQTQKVASAISAGCDLLSSYSIMRGLFSKDSRRSLMSDSASLRTGGGGQYDIPEETLALIKNGKGEADVFNEICRYELSLYMANMLLRDTDVMSMASALEVRVPLLDHELVEWVCALPGSLKVGRHPKQLLIDALGSDLPAEITRRKKMGFALPFERWVHTSLRPFVSDALSDRAAVLRAGLNPEAVMGTVESFDSGSRSTSWSRVWGLAVLVDWCRRHDMEVAVAN
ncbi:MAG TPA: asparagine synthase (glutamine-hydrolyzing) [Blastocatellia bacterium]|jgi:asparagine synthase (glutamine-hydrolysing)|nr:asparagine synthase (glutamine-hydrolyzing) [Blastocatellia bacterium]